MHTSHKKSRMMGEDSVVILGFDEPAGLGLLGIVGLSPGSR